MFQNWALAFYYLFIASATASGRVGGGRGGGGCRKEWKYVGNQKGVVEKVGEDDEGEEKRQLKKKWRTAGGRKENVCAAKHRTSGRWRKKKKTKEKKKGGGTISIKAGRHFTGGFSGGWFEAAPRWVFSLQRSRPGGCGGVRRSVEASYHSGTGSWSR